MARPVTKGVSDLSNGTHYRAQAARGRRTVPSSQKV